MKKILALVFIGVTVFSTCFQFAKFTDGLTRENVKIVREGDDEEGIFLEL